MEGEQKGVKNIKMHFTSFTRLCWLASVFGAWSMVPQEIFIRQVLHNRV